LDLLSNVCEVDAGDNRVFYNREQFTYYRALAPAFNATTAVIPINNQIVQAGGEGGKVESGRVVDVGE